MTKEQVLKSKFGISAFRDKQGEVIDSLMADKNTLCLMPTGMGKSLVFQIAAILKGKMCLVISPLLALMDQQSESLNTMGLQAHSFNSDSGSTINQFKYLRQEFNPPKNPQFLYVSPEKMMIDGYAEFVLRKYKNEIGLVVIDEAHCVSQWGHSFRPAYKLIPRFLENIFGKNIPSILCLTATLNQQDEKEIVSEFKIENIIKSDSLLRHNIELHIEDEVVKNEDKKEILETIIRTYQDEKIIVYTHIKNRDYGTRKMSEYFRQKGYACAPFDADLPKKEKNTTLKEFSEGKIKIVFATGAFGMGIDIPDIRVVVHYLLPESLEQYYQEVGRAGRDLKPSFAYLLQAEPNYRIKRDLIKKGRIKKEDIQMAWEIFSRNKFPYIGQLGLSDVSDDNSQLIIFAKFLEKGHLEIITKGLQDIDSFKEKRSNPIFQKYSKSSRKGHLKLISKRCNEELSLINQNIFKMYDSGDLELCKSPTKVLFYKITKPMTVKDLEIICDEFKELNDKNLKSLELLSKVLNKEQPVGSIIQNQFDSK